MYMETLKRVLVENPNLCANGWGTEPHDFERSRAHMTSPHGVEEFERALAFVEARCRPTKAITTHAGSYGYKHMAENWHRRELGDAADCYVSNGALIAAALALGYRHRRLPGSPNCLFNFARVRAA
jgi:hypothetical protein